MTIGERVKIWRKEHGLAQSDLEKLANLSNGYVSLLERSERKPKKETIEKLATAMNISVMELNDSDDSPGPPPYPYQLPEALEFFRVIELFPAKDWPELFSWARYLALGKLQESKPARELGNTRKVREAK